jgi:F-type H+-transporting ATPase subunit delta
MAAGTVAGVYAQALLEAADVRDTRGAVVENCRLLAGVVADGDAAALPALDRALIARLDDPRLGKHKAKEALSASLAGRVERVVLDLLLLLVDRNRLADAPVIFAEAVRLAEQQAGIVHVTVTSAVPLTPALRERLTRRMHVVAGPGAQIEERIEPNLIGGLTVRIGDHFGDGSVKRKLADYDARIRSAPISTDLWSA